MNIMNYVYLQDMMLPCFQKTDTDPDPDCSQSRISIRVFVLVLYCPPLLAYLQITLSLSISFFLSPPLFLFP